jgi:hypothetical protein
MPCSFSQYYGARTGTAGTLTFCPSGTETGMHYGSGPDMVPEPELDPEPTKNVIKSKQKKMIG